MQTIRALFSKIIAFPCLINFCRKIEKHTELLHISKKNSTFEHLPWLLFYVCANPPSGDLSGAELEVPSEALLHLVATFAKCSPYYSTLALFENSLRLLNQPLCRSYVSKLPTSSRETDSIDRIYYFQKKCSLCLRMCIFCSTFAALFVQHFLCNLIIY